jgi:hypothetical protein
VFPPSLPLPVLAAALAPFLPQARSTVERT